jgi:hypothetical protein
MGLVLTVAPWTLFWERNYFLTAVSPIRTVVLSPWFRGAVSAVGVVTIIAGLVDLFSVMARQRPTQPESASSTS